MGVENRIWPETLKGKSEKRYERFRITGWDGRKLNWMQKNILYGRLVHVVNPNF